MDRQPVNSSHLVSVGYDAGNQLLEVEFKSGDVYQYMNVPEFEFDQLMQAPSQGIYFNANIRNDYQNHRV